MSSLLKQKVYEDSRQFTPKNSLREAIQVWAAAIEKDAIKKLTVSMDNRLVVSLING